MGLRAPLLILLMSFTLSVAFPVFTSVKADSYIPFPPYHVEPINKILYPRLAAPKFTRPGGSFMIFLAGSFEVSSVSIFDDVRGLSFSLDIANVAPLTDSREGAVVTEMTSIYVNVPGDAAEGLYDIIVSTASGTLREPNALVVVKEFPDTYVIGHISDTHLGGWGGKYIEAYANFDKAIYSLEALGVDIIVCSGDFIEQNKEAGIKHIYDILSKLAVPFTTALGNTDYTFNTKGIYLIEKYFAPDSSLVDMGNAIIINIDAETGDIAEDVVYNWIRDTLSFYSDVNLKILNSHYPNWDPNVVSSRFIDFFKSMNDQFGISLFLNGHIHRNTKKVSDTTGILTITTTSTEISSEFLGFRLIYGSSDGSVSAPDDAIYNLENMYVKYAQDNFFAASGQSVVVHNDLDYAINLTLYFKVLDTGQDLLLNGSPVTTGVFAFSDDGSKYKTLVLDVSVPPGSHSVYVVSQGVDDEAPTAKVVIDTFKQYYYFKISASDEGTGVAKIDVYYSIDNSTWKECKYVVIDSWPYPTAPRELEGFYYKIILTDYSGNRNTIYGLYGSPSKPSGGGGGEQPPGGVASTTMIFAVGAVTVLVVVLVYLFRRRK